MGRKNLLKKYYMNNQELVYVIRVFCHLICLFLIFYFYFFVRMRFVILFLISIVCTWLCEINNNNNNNYIIILLLYAGVSRN